MANQKTEQKHQDWKLAFCLNSLYVAILVPGQHRVLRFNGVQVKPQLCTWEQSCAAHCCCVERWGGNWKSWLESDPRGTAGKAKRPFQGIFYGRGTYYSSDLMDCLLKCPSVPHLLHSWWSRGCVPFPALPKRPSQGFLFTQSSLFLVHLLISGA